MESPVDLAALLLRGPDRSVSSAFFSSGEVCAEALSGQLTALLVFFSLEDILPMIDSLVAQLTQLAV